MHIGKVERELEVEPLQWPLAVPQPMPAASPPMPVEEPEEVPA